jgi:hypothetical protein
MLAAPPVVFAFSATITDAPFSAAVIAAAKPESPAATTTISASSFMLLLLSSRLYSGFSQFLIIK